MMTRFQFGKILVLIWVFIALCVGCDPTDLKGSGLLGDVAVDGSTSDAAMTDGPRSVPDAVTGMQCSSDGECGDGKLCDPYRTVCTPECSTRQDCPAWVYCLLRPGRGGRICTPRQPGEIYSLAFAGDNCTAGSARCQRAVAKGGTLRLQVRVKAGNSNVENANVQFSVVASGGTGVNLARKEATTNADGTAEVELRAGNAQGIADVQAKLPGGSPITWKITVESQ